MHYEGTGHGATLIEAASELHVGRSAAEVQFATA